MAPADLSKCQADQESGDGAGSGYLGREQIPRIGLHVPAWRLLVTRATYAFVDAVQSCGISHTWQSALTLPISSSSLTTKYAERDPARRNSTQLLAVYFRQARIQLSSPVYGPESQYSGLLLTPDSAQEAGDQS